MISVNRLHTGHQGRFFYWLLLSAAADGGDGRLPAGWRPGGLHRRGCRELCNWAPPIYCGIYLDRYESCCSISWIPNKGLMQMERMSSCLTCYQQPESADFGTSLSGSESRPACKHETSKLRSSSRPQAAGSDDVTTSHDPSAQSGFALTIICSGCGSHELIQV